MDPVGGDLFVVGSTQQPQQSGKNGQKLAGNHQNINEPHQTVSHFFDKKGLDSNSGRQKYLYSDVVRIHESLADSRNYCTKVA